MNRTFQNEAQRYEKNMNTVKKRDKIHLFKKCLYQNFNVYKKNSNCNFVIHAKVFLRVLNNCKK